MAGGILNPATGEEVVGALETGVELASNERLVATLLNGWVAEEPESS